MMLDTIIASFSPTDPEKWLHYCEWRGMQFERFDSNDSVLRTNLFEAPNDDDWAHVVTDDSKLHLITDLPHAQRKQKEIGKRDLPALRFKNQAPSEERFLGFDIIDGFYNLPPLANWGE